MDTLKAREHLGLAAMAVSLLALLFAVTSGSTPCANAQESCAAGEDVQILGALVANEDAQDADSRIEGQTDPNLTYWDASTDRVGIGTDSPGSLLHVDGEIENAGLVDIAEVFSDTAPDNSTTTWDPNVDGGLANGTYMIVVGAEGNATGDPISDGKGFRGAYLWHNTGTTASNVISEFATVQGYGTDHTASVDANGVITYGTSATEAVRADITVQAFKLGDG